MKRIPNWIWPKDKRHETSPVIRIGRAIHWASALLAALLLCLAFLAAASAALAQESEAFNAASPTAQQAIRDQRAMRQEIQRRLPTQPQEPDPFDRFDISPDADLSKPQRGVQTPQIRERLDRAGRSHTAPAKNYFDRFDTRSPGQPPLPAGPPPVRPDYELAYGRGQNAKPAEQANAEWESLSRKPPPDCALHADGSTSIDDGSGLCPNLTAARLRKNRQSSQLLFAPIALISAFALLLAGRGIRYILADE